MSMVLLSTACAALHPLVRVSGQSQGQWSEVRARARGGSARGSRGSTCDRAWQRRQACSAPPGHPCRWRPARRSHRWRTLGARRAAAATPKMAGGSTRHRTGTADPARLSPASAAKCPRMNRRTGRIRRPPARSTRRRGSVSAARCPGA
eukprot:scaffold73339_cov60-Phaeocystis_antarctica.AAC.7